MAEKIEILKAKEIIPISFNFEIPEKYVKLCNTLHYFYGIELSDLIKDSVEGLLELYNNDLEDAIEKKE